MKNGIWVASFDIGKKNFSWCIEEFDRKQLSCISDIEKEKRYNKNGTTTVSMENILTKIYNIGRVISHENVDLTKTLSKEEASKQLDVKILINMYELLESNLDLWSLCDFILIEEQMHFGSKINFMAIKLAQHCFSYFIFKFGNAKTIIDFPSYHKTQVLGAYKVESNKSNRYKAMTKTARKKWAVTKAIEILELRKEKNKLNEPEVKGKKNKKIKKDDLADTFLMCQAFKYLHFIES